MRRPLALLALSGCTWLGRDALDRDGDGVPDVEDCDFHSPRASLGGEYIVYFQDNDADGYGAGNPIRRCETELVGDDLVQRDGDCNDGDPSLQPQTRWVPDADGDGYATAGPVVTACEAPVGHIQEELAPQEVDCDDGNAQASPGLVEITGNAVDEDCDGSTEGDADGDGFPTPFDCDDTDPDVHPAATETCNGVDDDCANGADEDDPNLVPSASSFVLFRDEDGDGHPADLQGLLVCTAPSDPALVLESSLDPAYQLDCDDTEPLAFPREQDPDLADAIDGDCDGVVYEDNDLDGVSSLTDCNDFDATVYPGQPERCDPHDVDENCNGLSDEADPTLEEQGSVITGYADQDGDGYASSDVPSIFCELPEGFTDIPPTAAGDCDDHDPHVNPAQPEVCNGVDDDCANGVDEEDPHLQASATSFVLYRDADGDGHPASLDGLIVCTQPSDPELVLVGTLAADFGLDCDDSEPLAFPQAQDPDLSDPIDNDCDGIVYEDNDGDGTTSLTDCDDFDPDANPGQPEVCDFHGIDEDCDGLVDEHDPDLDPATGVFGYPDLDGDGTAGSATGTLFCVLPDDHTTTAPTQVDCADHDAAVYPTRVESPTVEGDTSATDLNCNGVVDFDQDGDGYWPPTYGGTDCDDDDATRNPGQPEQGGDAIDSDCDGFPGALCFRDDDGDGYGAGVAELIAANGCAVSGFSGLAGDCADDDEQRYPGALEICDGVDNDCDGQEAYGLYSSFDGYGDHLSSEPLVDGAIHDLSYGSEIALCGEQDGALTDATLNLGDLAGRSIWVHGVEVRPTDLNRTRLMGETASPSRARVTIEQLSFTGSGAYGGGMIELAGYDELGGGSFEDRDHDLTVTIQDVWGVGDVGEPAVRIAAEQVDIRDSGFTVQGAPGVEVFGQLDLTDTVVTANGATASVVMEGGTIQGWGTEPAAASSTRIDASGLVILSNVSWTGAAGAFLHVRPGAIGVMQDSILTGATQSSTVLNEGLLYIQRTTFDQMALGGAPLLENRAGAIATLDQTELLDTNLSVSGYLVYNLGNLTLREVLVDQAQSNFVLANSGGVLDVESSTLISHAYGSLAPQIYSDFGTVNVRDSTLHRLSPGPSITTRNDSFTLRSSQVTTGIADPTGQGASEPVIRTFQSDVELLDTAFLHGGAAPVVDATYGSLELRGNSLAWHPGGANASYRRTYDLTDLITSGLYSGGAALGPPVIRTQTVNFFSTAPRTGTTTTGYDVNGTLTSGYNLFVDPFGEVAFDLVENAYGSFQMNPCNFYSIYAVLGNDPAFGGCSQHLLELWIN